jgi:hypothetical protein
MLIPRSDERELALMASRSQKSCRAAKAVDHQQDLACAVRAALALPGCAQALDATGRTARTGSRGSGNGSLNDAIALAYERSNV